MFLSAAEDTSGSRFTSNGLALPDNGVSFRVFLFLLLLLLASLDASAAPAQGDVFVKVYDLLILIICLRLLMFVVRRRNEDAGALST